jgi:hypothetical protein
MKRKGLKMYSFEYFPLTMLLASLFVLSVFSSINAFEKQNFVERSLLNPFNICYDDYGCFTSLPPFGKAFLFIFLFNKNLFC